MESDSTPELVINLHGFELTQKIAELMRHPKSDMAPEFLEEIEEFDPGVDIDALRLYQRSLLTAYRDPRSGISAHLAMPQPDSPSLNSAEKRWNLDIEIPRDQVGEYKMITVLHLEIDEETYDPSIVESTRINDKEGYLVKPTQRPMEFDENEIEAVMIQRTEEMRERRELQEQLTPEYKFYHAQVIEILNSFNPEHEVIDYDPANGVGI